MSWIFDREEFNRAIQQNPKAHRIAGRICLVASLACLIIGGAFLVRTIQFQQQALSATSTVLACDFPQGDQACFPRVRFTTMAGHTITVQITSSGSSTYHRGDTLPVQYHLATPEDAQLADTISLLAPFYFFVGFFFVCLFLSRYSFWLASERT